MGANIRAVKLNKLFKLYATFLVVFLLAYIVSGVVSPIPNSSAITCDNGMISGTDDICGSDTTDVNVSIDGAWTVAVSSSGTLNVDVIPSSSGTTSTATDNVNIYTNTPNGYQLYLNSTNGSTDIYNNSDTEHERNHFIATTGTKDSPIALSSNSWGYSLSPNPTTFSKVEASSSTVDALISTGSKTSGSGDNLDVTYGFNADTKLMPGTYTTSVTYTAVAEVPNYSITSISPSELALGDQTSKTFTILTSTPASELGLGTITAKFIRNDGTSTIEANLTNCTEITQEVSGINYRGASCSYTGNLPLGIYDLRLTSSWHSATYTLTDALSIYTTMQTFTSSQCTNLAESTETLDNRIILKDSRDNKEYKVSKLADGNCWMVSNLALDGTDSNGDVRVLTPADSNVAANHTLAPNIPNYTPDSYDDVIIYSGNANDVTVYKEGVPHRVLNDVKFGNYYNWHTATATVGTINYVSDTITESICPKNWQLPNNIGDNSFNSLFAAYNLPTSIDMVIDADAIIKVQSPPLYFAAAGLYNEYAKPQGAGFYWSRTDYDKTYYVAYNFNFYPSVDHFYAQNYGLGKLYGFSVRCVFGS